MEQIDEDLYATASGNVGLSSPLAAFEDPLHLHSLRAEQHLTDLEVFQSKSGSPPSLSLQTNVDLESLVNLWFTADPTHKTHKKQRDV